MIPRKHLNFLQLSGTNNFLATFQAFLYNLPMMLKKVWLLTLVCLLILLPENSFAQKKKTTTKGKPKTPKIVSIIGDSNASAATAPPISGDYIPSNATPAQKRRYETFDKVWNTINDYYFDPTFNGLDWKAVRTEFRAKIPTLKSDFELHQIIQEMINRFHRSHFYVILPEAFLEIENAKAQSLKKELERKKTEKPVVKQTDEKFEKEPDDKPDGEIFYKYGLLIDLRIINSQVVITEVKKDSKAEKAGLKSGFVLEKINGISLKDLIYRIENYKYSADSLKKQMPKILLSFLEGEEDSEVEITYLDERNEAKTVMVKREGLGGELVTILQSLPEQLVTFEKRSLDEKTGYIRFNFFAFPILNQFCEALTEFKGKDSLVIDLRGNSGGAISVLWGLSGLLIDKPMILGTEIKRGGKDLHLIRPMPKNFKGKIVILVDQQSVSAAEIFASGFQENNRAMVIGTKTAGEALPSLSVSLPTGGSFIYPFASFQSPKGKILEGKGVEPNISIPLERKLLLEGRDIQLEAAVSYLKAERMKPVAMADDEEPPPPVKKIYPTPTPITKAAPPPVLSAIPVQSIEKIENKQDEKALQVINNFLNAAGGEQALRQLTTLYARGEVELKQGGSIVDGKFEIFRKAPDKVAEVMFFDGSGEVREVFDGHEYFVQSLFTGIVKQIFLNNEYRLFADFYEFANFKALYPNIKYSGTSERAGRKTEVIEATTAKGIRVEFAFDAETKLLMSRNGTFLNYTFDNYKKFGNLMIPTTQTRQNIFTIKIYEVKFNTQIPDSKFVKEDNCFTKID